MDEVALRDITDRAEKIKDLSNKNFLLSESMPENTFDNYREGIETALETHRAIRKIAGVI